MGSISREEVLMGRDVEYPLTLDLEANLAVLLERLNLFRQLYGHPMVVSSGYRPGKYNEAAGGAKNSAHLTCQACDFEDASGVLKAYIRQNPGILDTCNLYQEHPDSTPTWLHVQTRPTVTRIFNP